MADKTVVNGLWLGNSKLTPLEMLTLNSFSRHGAEFHLWCYEKINTPLPPQIVIRNGNEILPKERIFKYPQKMMLNFGAGSYVGFSEIFRYKVLYDIGGWWSDMDVTCLKPIEDIEDPYFFRNHGVLSVVGNIMKVPPKSELMRLCYERASVEVNSQQDDWHHAIRILCYYIEYLGLSHYIHKDACNLDRLDSIWPYINEEMELDQIPRTWRFIHWMNSVIPKMYKKNSIFEKLLEEYEYKIKPIFA
jgi:hypothetical protein